MDENAKSFRRVFFWCWLPILLAACVFMLTIGTRGEPMDWRSGGTWLAVLYGLVLSAAVAVPPAFGFAALFAAASWWAKVARSVPESRR